MGPVNRLLPHQWDNYILLMIGLSLFAGLFFVVFTNDQIVTSNIQIKYQEPEMH